MELVTSRKCDDDIFLICVISLCAPGSPERENERRAQQAFVWHRRSAANRVQRTPAASSEGAHGRPGGQGKASHQIHANCSCFGSWLMSKKKNVFRLFCLERPHSGSRKLPKTAWRIPSHQGWWSFIELPIIPLWFHFSCRKITLSGSLQNLLKLYFSLLWVIWI